MSLENQDHHWLVHAHSYFPLFVGVLCLSLFCYALLCVHSSFAITLKRKRKLVASAIIVLQMYGYYKCSVALLYGTVGWSAVCDCGISRSYSLTFLYYNVPSFTVKNRLSRNPPPPGVSILMSIIYFLY